MAFVAPDIEAETKKALPPSKPVVSNTNPGVSNTPYGTFAKTPWYTL